MVIAMLVLINIVFLTVIGMDTVADAQSERQALINACTVLQNGGITIDPSNVKTSGALRAMRTARVDEAESIIARTFLGITEMTDQGVIYLYENGERGKARFYSAGDFEILLYGGVVGSSGGALRTVQRLMRDMNLEASSLLLSSGQGHETVTAICAIRGVTVFNCTIEFVFRGGYLERVEGRYLSGIEIAEDGAEISSAGTALLGFLAWVRRESVDCSRIYSVEAGYHHRVSGSFGEGLIIPVWMITTDSGKYILDDATGEVWVF